MRGEHKCQPDFSSSDLLVELSLRHRGKVVQRLQLGRNEKRMISDINTTHRTLRNSNSSNSRLENTSPYFSLRNSCGLLLAFLHFMRDRLGPSKYTCQNGRCLHLLDFTCLLKALSSLVRSMCRGRLVRSIRPERRTEDWPGSSSVTSTSSASSTDWERGW